MVWARVFHAEPGVGLFLLSMHFVRAASIIRAVAARHCTMLDRHSVFARTCLDYTP